MKRKLKITHEITIGTRKFLVHESSKHMVNKGALGIVMKNVLIKSNRIYRPITIGVYGQAFTIEEIIYPNSVRELTVGKQIKVKG